MKIFYDSKEPMNCLEALWCSAGLDDEVVAVKAFNAILYIECDQDCINVYNDEERKTLLASFNAAMSIEYTADIIEHMIFKLKS